MLTRPISRRLTRPLAVFRRAARGGPSVSPTVALAYSATMAAPAGFEQVPIGTMPPIVYVDNEGAYPVFPGVPEGDGGYVRHGWSSTRPDQNERQLLDLAEVAHIWNFENWGPVFGGNVKEPAADTSDYEQWASSTGDTAGAFGSMNYGFRTTGRYLNFAARSHCRLMLEVDGVLMRPHYAWPSNNRMGLADLGPGPHNVVHRGGPDSWSAGFCVPVGDVITPYDYTAGKPAVAIIGDSIFQGGLYESLGMSIGEYVVLLMGGHSYQASIIGGSGWAADTGGGNQSADDPLRIDFVIAAKPDVVVFPLGLNDNLPAYQVGNNPPRPTVPAIAATLGAYSTGLPDALLVVWGPMQPNENRATNPQDTPARLAAEVLAQVRLLPNDWIFINPLDGTFECSNGAKSPTVPGPWQTGTGTVDAPTGVGNGDQWVSTSDYPHLVEAGSLGIAGKFIGSYRQALAALVG